MKNMLKTGIVSAIAAVFVASVAVAGGQDQGQRRGPGMRGQGPGGPGRGMMGVVMRDLTEEQRGQIRAIMDEQRPQEGPPPDAKLRQSLEAELLADVPNDQKIEELKAQILAAEADGLARHIAIQKRIAQVLTPEQRAKARERLAEGPGPGRGFRF